MSSVIDHVVHLSEESVRKLKRIALEVGTTEDALIEKALDLLFDQGDDERKAWIKLSQPSLQRVWDNDADAVYDNWKELYGVSQG